MAAHGKTHLKINEQINTQKILKKFPVIDNFLK